MNDRDKLHRSIIWHQRLEDQRKAQADCHSTEAAAHEAKGHLDRLLADELAEQATDAQLAKYTLQKELAELEDEEDTDRES